jgi:hypothetical protein
VQDQVIHDKYGLGRIISVEADTALIIGFGPGRADYHAMPEPTKL